MGGKDRWCRSAKYVHQIHSPRRSATAVERNTPLRRYHRQGYRWIATLVAEDGEPDVVSIDLTYCD